MTANTSVSIFLFLFWNYIKYYNKYSNPIGQISSI